MKSNNFAYPLLESVDQIEEKKHHHTMLLYDNPKYGLIVRNRFIENGLKKGDVCICTTFEDISKTENELALTGIDVNYYKQKNQLQVIRIENLIEGVDDAVSGFNDMTKKIMVDPKLSYRFAGRAIYDITTKEGIQAELDIEHAFHSQFDKLQCSFLCTYPVDDIEKTKRSFWINKILSEHHNLIYATEPSKAVVFEPELLTPE